jgi:cell division protein FtsI (penicillin-binding protein 3)
VGGLNKKRAIILYTAVIVSFCLVFLRLADLMIFNYERLSAKADKQHMKTQEIQTRRGIIYDRRGRELALNLELDSLYCDPKELDRDPGNFRELASAMSEKPQVILAKIPEQGRFAWIERKLDPYVVEKIKALNIKGFGFLNEAKRFYPREELASHVLGFVGIDNQALEGIELKYDKYLKTAGGKVLLKRDARGNTLSLGVEREAKGNDLVLTIDEVLQRTVEKELDAAMSLWKASAASVIMMDPFTGEILALANRPTYNPNNGNRARADTRRNRAITDCYEPGSTFKIVIGVGSLEEGLTRPNTMFDVSKGSIEVGGKTMRDSHRHEALSFTEVIQKSSNVGSIMVGMRLGKERLFEYARRMGIGQKTGIDLPGEVSGWIYPPERWSGTSIGAISIGQEVAVTPLQMLRAYAAIANGGFLVTPHVVSKVVSPDGEVLFASRKNNAERIISGRTAGIFRNILKTVVEEGGTGTEASVDGNAVAGKTGTAQMVDPKTKQYSKDKFVSSFVGFVPAEHPRLAMIVVVYQPQAEIYGGVVAAPVFKRISSQALSYMGVPREDNFRKQTSLVVAR